MMGFMKISSGSLDSDISRRSDSVPSTAPPQHQGKSTQNEQAGEALRLLRESRARRQQELGGDVPSSTRRGVQRRPENVFKYTEVNEVLSEVVERDGDPGLILALLDHDSDVNFSRRRSRRLWNKVLQRNQEEIRNDVMQRATSHCRAEVVDALARRADQVTLNAALSCAILRGDVGVLRTLLQYGADPTELHAEFEQVLSANRTDLLEALLLGSPGGAPCLACRCKGLRIAVQNDSTETLRMLLGAGADANHEGGIALCLVARALRVDLVSLLLSKSNIPVSPSCLDVAMAEVYRITVGDGGEDVASIDTSSGYVIIDMCLSAGASGPCTTRLLTHGFSEAIQQRRAQLLDVLLKFEKPAGDAETAALRAAIFTRQKEILVRLLQLQPSSTGLTAAASEVVGLANPVDSYSFAEAIVDAGARGSILGDALVLTVRKICRQQHIAKKEQLYDSREGNRLFDLFLDSGGADVDHEDGKALQMAVQEPCSHLVHQLVSHRPSPKTLGMTLPIALGLADHHSRQCIVETLLQHPVCQDAVDTALVDTIKTERNSRDLVSLLLRQASVDYRNGEPLVQAIQRLDLDLMRVLLLQGPNSQSLASALTKALRLTSNRTTLCNEMISHFHQDHLNAALRELVSEHVPDLDLMRTFLTAGADAAHDNGICIRAVTLALDLAGLQLLAEFSGYNQAIYTQAFSQLTCRDGCWMDPQHLSVMNFLFQQGASGSPVHKALVQAVHQFGEALDDRERAMLDQIVECLLAARADINFEGGAAVNMAASFGHVQLLHRLLGQSPGPTALTAMSVLRNAINAGHDEYCLLQLIDAIDTQSMLLDPNQVTPGIVAPIILCLRLYRNSPALLNRLVGVGCDLEVVTQTKTIDGIEEPGNLLLWSLSLPWSEGGVSDEVVTTIVQHRANVSYSGAQTQVTPLMLAARDGRLEVVKRLLEAGAEAGAKDYLQRSVLSYAARSREPAIVSLVLECNPAKNDGTLHEAARWFDADIITLLVAAGHDPNYRSAQHGGRTVLGDLALNGSKPEDNKQAYQALQVLVNAGADPLAQVHGKSVVFLALENKQDPISATRFLVDNLLYKTINADENMCVPKGSPYHYSPTMYLKKGLAQCTQGIIPHLLALLEDHGARDCYYADLPHDQPPDAVNMPPKIKAVEDYKQHRAICHQISEEDFQNQQRRQVEAVVLGQKMREIQVGGAIDMDNWAHEAQMGRDLREAEVKAHIAWKQFQGGQARLAEERQANLNHADAVHAHGQRIRDINHQQALRLRGEQHWQLMAQGRDYLALQGEHNSQNLAQAKALQKNQLQFRGAAHAQGLQFQQEVNTQELNHSEIAHRRNVSREVETAQRQLIQRQNLNAQQFNHTRNMHTQHYGHASRMGVLQASQAHQMDQYQLKEHNRNMIEGHQQHNLEITRAKADFMRSQGWDMNGARLALQDV